MPCLGSKAFWGGLWVDKAELVGGVLHDVEDPNVMAAQLADLLISPTIVPQRVRELGLEPALVKALRRALPADPAAIQSACARGAAWVLGRRSIARPDSWELVASLPPETPLPVGLRRATAETLIALVTEARSYLRFAAPYVDQPGVRVLVQAISAATLRGVMVELFEPPNWNAGPSAIADLQRSVRQEGDMSRLVITRTMPDAPWSHLKVVIADGSSAYIGSANITGAGLVGRNLELGVLVRGPNVAVVDRILNLYREG